MKGNLNHAHEGGETDKEGQAMFDHKIEKFTKTVGGLPDQPNIEPQALKNWFDAAPEELRQSLNGVCEDGAVLESRVNGIIERTFAGNVSESMLDDALAGKLNGKAEGSALTAEQSARADADATLQKAIDVHTTQIALKTQITAGLYSPSNTTTTDAINLGFAPKAVILIPRNPEDGYVYSIRIAFKDTPHDFLSVTDTGFAVAYASYRASAGSSPYRYLAFQ